jgi:hypothetical protein
MASLLAGRRGLLLFLRDGGCRHQQKMEMKEIKSLGLRRYECGSEGLSLPLLRGRGGLLSLIPGLRSRSSLSSGLFRSMSSSYSTSASGSVSPRRWLVYTTIMTTTKTAPFGTRNLGSSSSSGGGKLKDESSQKLRNRNHEEHEKTDTKRTTITSENGSHARTDGDIKIGYPYSHPPEDIPSSSSSSGEGKGQASPPRTLQTFTLQGNVGVVTGGARGLGLVMGTGMVRSGADLAIVDLNGLCDLFSLFFFPFALPLFCSSPTPFLASFFPFISFHFLSFPSVFSPVSDSSPPPVCLFSTAMCERKENVS